jgi:hypothetical protein
MSEAPERHPSPFEMMRVLSGELDPRTSEQIRVHSATCTSCQVSFRELEGIQAAGAAEAPPFPLRLVQKRAWPKYVGAFALAASITAVMLLSPPSSEVRKKGGAEIRMYCQRPDQNIAELCRSGSKVPPGTSIAFRAELKETEWIMIYGYDGKWTRHFPQTSEQAVRVGRDREDLMNGSLVLDGSSGPETFVIFRGTKSFDHRAVVLGENGDVAVPPAGIEMVRFEIEKQMSQSGKDIR